MPPVPRMLGRKTGAIGIALTAYDLWLRLPEKQRRQLLAHGRRHGTRLAASAARRGMTHLRNRRS